MSAGIIVSDRYRLERRLGAGRSTEVWLGTTASGESIALKALNAEWLLRPGARDLIRREYELLSSLRHPHVVKVSALVDEPGLVAFAAEYLEGGDLVSLRGATPCHWIEPARDVLAALDFVHRRGFVHRDVKARNVMFDGRGHARLVDFGSAARIGAPCSAHGTTAAHRYPRPDGALEAPEHDLYAFAVLLYELMSGSLPFGTAPPGTPPPSELRPPLTRHGADRPDLRALQKLVLAALEPGSGRSIGSLSTFVNVIESVIANESSQT